MSLGKDTEWLKEDLLFPVCHFEPFIFGPCRCIIYSKSKWMHFTNKMTSDNLLFTGLSVYTVFFSYEHLNFKSFYFVKRYIT